MSAFVGRVAARGADVYVGDPGRAFLPVHRLVPAARYEVPDAGPVTVWRPVPRAHRVPPAYRVPRALRGAAAGGTAP